MPRKFKQGMVIGKLTVSNPYVKKIGKHWAHKCLCACGNIGVYAGGDISKKKFACCSCSRGKHRMSGSQEYTVWAAMMQRCNNPKNAAYMNYGGRGISVCKDWHNFECFHKDMGIKPNSKMTLERIDNDKGYSPSNCVWASRSAQSMNQRIRKDNKTGEKGVSMLNGVFIVSKTINGKRKYLGRHKTIFSAKLAIKEFKHSLLAEKQA